MTMDDTVVCEVQVALNVWRSCRKQTLKIMTFVIVLVTLCVVRMP